MRSSMPRGLEGTTTRAKWGCALTQVPREASALYSRLAAVYSNAGELLHTAAQHASANLFLRKGKGVKGSIIMKKGVAARKRP